MGRDECFYRSTLELRDELGLIVQFTQDVICDLTSASTRGIMQILTPLTVVFVCASKKRTNNQKTSAKLHLWICK